MNLKVVELIVCIISAFSSISPVLALKRDDPCTTPNGETARCKLVRECKVITDALVANSTDPEVLIFARRSHEGCGFDDEEAMVCCGNYATAVVGETCTTPNGESATCMIPSSCTVITEALKTGNANATEFAKRSLCVSKKATLACCGSEAYLLRTDFLPNRTVCGQQKSDGRIYGGTVTKPDEFPWTALLFYVDINGDPTTDFRCGGALINERYVLTAAHCVSARTGISIDKVRLGEWKVSSVIDCEEGVPNPKCAAPVIDVKIEEQVVHHDYGRGYGQNDIALLRLERNVVYTEYVRPICLPVAESPEPMPGTEMFLAGWGQTETASESDIKMKAVVPIVSKEFCSQNLRIKGVPFEGQICAGIGSNDSCFGDSGGPLMQKVRRDLFALPRWYQEGIVSWGLRCAEKNSPAVYTRVAVYMDWILENLKPF